jgi:CBS domain-containing protein
MKKKKASDLMTKTVMTTTPDARLLDAIDLLMSHDIGFLPVVDAKGFLVGILTEYDIMNYALSGEADRATVGEAMSRKVISFAPDADFETIASCCIGQRVHRVPVVEGGKVVGIISRHDVLRAMLELYRR